MTRSSYAGGIALRRVARDAREQRLLVREPTADPEQPLHRASGRSASRTARARGRRRTRRARSTRGRAARAPSRAGNGASSWTEESFGSRRIWSNASAAVSVALSSRSFFAASSRAFASALAFWSSGASESPGCCRLLPAGGRAARAAEAEEAAGAPARRRGSALAAARRARAPASASGPGREPPGTGGASGGAADPGLRGRRRCFFFVRSAFFFASRFAGGAPRSMPSCARAGGAARSPARTTRRVARVMGLTGADGCGPGGRTTPRAPRRAGSAGRCPTPPFGTFTA